jgi:hypothetical protein
MTKEVQKQVSPPSEKPTPVPRRSAVLAALSLLGASMGLSLSEAAGQDTTSGGSKIQSDNQKQQMERWKIMQDTQTKIFQKSKGSTGPTVPPKPGGSTGTMAIGPKGGSTGPTVPPNPGGSRK